MKTTILFVILTTVLHTAYTQNQVSASNMKTSQHQNIIAVIQNIFEGADERNWKKIENALAPKVLLDYTSLAGGNPVTLTPTEITAAWKALLPGFQSTHHQIGSFSITSLKDNEASVTFHGLAVHYLPQSTGESFWTVVGTYDYHLIKIGDSWKADRMQFSLQKQQGNLGLVAVAQDNVKKGVTFNRVSPSKSVKAVVAKFFSALENLDIQSFLSVWDKNGVQIMPLAPDGFPGLLEGRDAIYNQYKGLPDNFTAMSFPYRVFATEDSNRLIAQYTGYIPLKNGGEYNNNYVGIFEVKDGLLVKFTEHFDPFILEGAFGGDLQSNFNVEVIEKN